jgi:flavorubredoxin
MSVIANGAVTVVPDKLYALGGIVELDERVSWVPRGTRGFEPVLAYLLLDGTRALLIDTGTGCHRDLILRQLRELLSPGSDLAVFVSRAEFDNALNFQAVVHAYPNARVLGTNRQCGSFLSTYPNMRLDRHPRVEIAEPGSSIVLGPDREVKVYDAPLRVLTAGWLFDTQTGVIFTSDAFGHAHLARRDETIVLDEEHDPTTLEHVRDHLLTKFDWLAEADTRETLAMLHAIFDQIAVSAIAPGHGRMLTGGSVVRRHLQLVTDVLSALHVSAPGASLAAPSR